MHCPNDNTLLQMTSRDGIEIDYCPQCRGVWLDRGELDKLIERSARGFGPAPKATEHYGQPSSHREYDDDDDDERHHYGRHDGDYGKHGGHHRKKREGFLGDLFDF